MKRKFMATSTLWATLPQFSKIAPTQIEPMMRQLLDRNREKIQQLLAQSPAYHWGNLMQPLEDMSDELNKAWSPIAHLHATMESEALRKAYNAILPQLTAYHTELSQNDLLFQAISTLATSADFATFNAAQQKIIGNDIRDFKLAGIHLSPDKKSQFAALSQKLSQLMTTFSENVLDATHAWMLHLTDPAQLAGLPQSARDLAIENARQRNLNGYVLTLDYPSYSTSMRFLKNREIRQTLYEAYVTRASDTGPNAGKWDNTSVMEETLKTRQEIAKLAGFADYSEYSLATKMAKSKEEVLQFLQDLLKRSKPIAKQEYQTLLAFAQKEDHMTNLEAWDIAYYAEKLQESTFHFNQEDLRPYFPITQVLSGLFSLVNRLYGITIKKEEGIDVWHPQVEFFSIYDRNQQLQAGFYIDLYARQHKREGAWMDECQVRKKLNAHAIQYPVAYLTCNFMPPLGDQPALLTHDDVLTLFHEFGHCLHHLLSKVDYPSVSGINGVPWDAVEFPSQFMENFCWEKALLSQIAKHYQTGAPLPDELYNKMIAAKHFHTGLQMIRQIEFSLFDFRLHIEFNPSQPNPVQTILNAVRKETAVLPIPSFNRFQNSFSHIFGGGYAAGYYSYKWAEVLSADTYEQFEEHGIFDPATGEAFLKNILEVGGVVDPMIAFIAFRGRPPKIDALLRHSGIQH
jgi:oligopeptidase A